MLFSLPIELYKFLTPRLIKVQARHDYLVFGRLLERIEPYVTNFKGLNVLDVGCGGRAQTSRLFNSIGANAIGIDVSFLNRHLSLKKYKSILRSRGLRETLAYVIENGWFNFFYYKELEKVVPNLFENNPELLEMDASKETFSDNQFDLVISNAAFEHFKDVSSVLDELDRVMKPNALLHVEIHLYHSLTGGHNCVWSDPDTQQVIIGKVPAWDHLREQRYPAHAYLNKLKEKEYYELFARRFKILDWIDEYWEPKSFLTPKIKLELKDFTEEELLKRAIVIIAQKCKTRRN